MMRVLCVLALVVLTLGALPIPPTAFTLKATGTIIPNGTAPVTVLYTEYFDGTNPTNPQILTNLDYPYLKLNDSLYCSPTLGWNWIIPPDQTSLFCKNGKDCLGNPCKCRTSPAEYYNAEAGTRTGNCTFDGKNGINYNLKIAVGINSQTFDICFDTNNQVLGWNIVSVQGIRMTVLNYIVNTFSPTAPSPSVFLPPSTPVCPFQTGLGSP